MKYWPVSTMLNAGFLGPDQKQDLVQALRDRRPVSYPTLVACHRTADAVAGYTSLTLLYSEGAPFRRVYVKHPTMGEWLALERGGFIDAFGDFGYVEDAIH